MQITNSTTGDSYFSKRRRRFDEAMMPREFTFSCFRRYPFLLKDRTRRWFVAALENARSEHPIDLWAWVLMPDHVHLIVAPRAPGIELGRILGNVKEAVARKAIRWLGENSPDWLNKITVIEGDRVRRRFWQPGGGYDRNIELVSTLQGMIDYIHQNPVRRGLVARAADWRWSSAGFYAGLRSAIMKMDRTMPAFSPSATPHNSL